MAAILDDGVYEGFFPIPQIVERWGVSRKRQRARRAKRHPLSFPWHSLCSDYRKALPSSQFISLQVLDQEGQGSVAQLEAALHWCLEKRAGSSSQGFWHTAGSDGRASGGGNWLRYEKWTAAGK